MLLFDLKDVQDRGNFEPTDNKFVIRAPGDKPLRNIYFDCDGARNEIYSPDSKTVRRFPDHVGPEAALDAIIEVGAGKTSSGVAFSRYVTIEDASFILRTVFQWIGVAATIAIFYPVISGFLAGMNHKKEFPGGGEYNSIILISFLILVVSLVLLRYVRGLYVLDLTEKKIYYSHQLFMLNYSREYVPFIAAEYIVVAGEIIWKGQIKEWKYKLCLLDTFGRAADLSDCVDEKDYDALYMRAQLIAFLIKCSFAGCGREKILTIEKDESGNFMARFSKYVKPESIFKKLLGDSSLTKEATADDQLKAMLIVIVIFIIIFYIFKR